MLLLASLALLALSPVVSGYTYGLGKSFLIGNGSTSSITKVSTTFNPGTPPENQLGQLMLYPAMSNGTGDFLTMSIESWSNQTWCNGTIDQWCIRTSVFSDGHSTYGPFAPLNANEPVTFIFEQSPDESGWTQSAVANNQVVSQLTFPSGPMTLFGVTTECDNYCSMTVSPQTYTNTTIELVNADESWGSTSVVGSQIYGDGTADVTGQNATVVSGISSSEGGKLWTIDEILIPQLN